MMRLVQEAAVERLNPVERVDLAVAAAAVAAAAVAELRTTFCCEKFVPSFSRAAGIQRLGDNYKYRKEYRIYFPLSCS